VYATLTPFTVAGLKTGRSGSGTNQISKKISVAGFLISQERGRSPGQKKKRRLMKIRLKSAEKLFQI
jgi:hypothetical protein